MNYSPAAAQSESLIALYASHHYKTGAKITYFNVGRFYMDGMQHCLVQNYSNPNTGLDKS